MLHFKDQWTCTEHVEYHHIIVWWNINRCVTVPHIHVHVNWVQFFNSIPQIISASSLPADPAYGWPFLSALGDNGQWSLWHLGSLFSKATRWRTFYDHKNYDGETMILLKPSKHEENLITSPSLKWWKSLPHCNKKKSNKLNRNQIQLYAINRKL